MTETIVNIPTEHFMVPKGIIHANGFQELTSRQNRIAMMLAGALRAKQFKENQEVVARFPLRDLMENYPGDEYHHDLLMDDLKEVAKCQIESRLRDDDGNLVHAFMTNVIASVDADFSDGHVDIIVPSRTLAIFNTPKYWAKIQKTAWLQMRSSHAQRLYLLIADQEGAGQRKNRIWDVELVEFRELMQVGDKYRSFPVFNRDVLKPAIEQINNMGLFDLSVELVRYRRKVGALRFRWVPKIGLPAAKAAKENDKPKKQQGKDQSEDAGPLFETDPVYAYWKSLSKQAQKINEDKYLKGENGFRSKRKVMELAYTNKEEKS